VAIYDKDLKSFRILAPTYFSTFSFSPLPGSKEIDDISLIADEVANLKPQLYKCP
jgi:hypothetical protein